MATSIPAVINDTLVNSMTVADILQSVNDTRAESNSDFLDEDVVIRYINRAISELNRRDDFRASERTLRYTVDTTSTKFYLFSTIFGAEPFERMKEIRFVADTARTTPLTHGVDYRYEASPTGLGKGIYFMTSLNAPLEFAYYRFIPKVTAVENYIEVDHLSNEYFINKVLQLVAQAEWIPDKVSFYKNEAEEQISKLIANNTDQYDDHALAHPFFQ